MDEALPPTVLIAGIAVVFIVALAIAGYFDSKRNQLQRGKEDNASHGS